MTRIFENRSVGKMAKISLVIVAAVLVYGVFELYRAFIAGTDDQLAGMFGVLFVGGGAIALNSIFSDSRDQVEWLDVDMAAKTARIAVWRPLGPQVFDLPLDRITNWRYWVKVARRNVQNHYLVAALPDYPRPVYLQLPAAGEVNPAFYEIAPEAMADYEDNTGRKRDEDDDPDETDEADEPERKR